MPLSIANKISLQALTEAAKSDDQHNLIFQSCYGLILFGVPNKGLEGQSLESMVKGQPNAALVEDLKAASEFLHRHNFFWKFQKPDDSRVISIYETQPTPTVEVSSADVVLGSSCRRAQLTW